MHPDQIKRIFRKKVGANEKVVIIYHNSVQLTQYELVFTKRDNV